MADTTKHPLPPISSQRKIRLYYSSKNVQIRPYKLTRLRSDRSSDPEEEKNSIHSSKVC